MLVFENNGEIDVTAMTTFGVNVKDDASSAIGFFGTGMKYAIAITLRLGGKIWVNAGLTHYEFKASPQNVRGKHFDIVAYTAYNSGGGIIEQRELGFTTELGKTWAAWMALRELWCNTADEKGFVKYLNDEDLRELLKNFPNFYRDVNITRIFVECPEIEAAYIDRDNYFLEPNDSMKRLALVDLVKREATPHLFYRGIRAYTNDNPYAWTWSIHRKMNLSEDRTLKEIFTANNAVMASIINSKDEELIAEFFSLPKEAAEHQCYFADSFVDDQARNITVAAMMRTYRVHGGKWHNSVKNFYHAELKKKGEADIQPAELTTVQSDSIEKALDFLTKLNIPARRYKLIVTDDLPPGTLGVARGQAIYINTTALNMGVKQVAGTIYEEFLHIHNGFRDESREFQNYLIDQVMTMGERIVGEPI